MNTVLDATFNFKRLAHIQLRLSILSFALHPRKNSLKPVFFAILLSVLLLSNTVYSVLPAGHIDSVVIYTVIVLVRWCSSKQEPT